MAKNGLKADGSYKRFRVEIGGLAAGFFTVCEGFELEVQVVGYQDGEDLFLRYRSGPAQHRNIILKQGRSTSTQLWQWMEQSLSGDPQRNSLSIVLMDKAAGEIGRRDFKAAWPCRWRSIDMDYEAANAEINELEIVIDKYEIS